MVGARDDEPLRIGEVAQLTGMSVPALRAWERRYGVPSPVRTAGGQRLYTRDDVERVRAVQGLVAGGWSVAGAARHVTAPPGQDAVEQDLAPSTTARGAPVDAAVAGKREALVNRLAALDAYGVVAAYETSRAMLRATHPAGVRDALVDLVERLGGEIGPAARQDDVVLPADISFGEGPPLLPRAAPESLARMRLEALLPLLLEDARLLVHRLELAELDGIGPTDRSAPRRARARAGDVRHEPSP